MNKRKIVLLYLLLVFAVFLTACGGESTPEINEGQSAPDFNMTTSDGTQVSLSDYKGQPVLLFFHMAGG
jgi:peroxiredoxin Q/BCP